MNFDLIETGKIVNTHGIRGELRLQPWADTPESLLGITSIYIDGEPIKLNSAKKHKSNLIISLEGIEDIDAAIKLKNKVVSVLRSEIALEEGTFFVADLIGLQAIDAETGDVLGTLEDVLDLPAHKVYVIKGERELLIPAVPEFIAETNLEKGYVKLHIIEGL